LTAKTLCHFRVSTFEWARAGAGSHPSSASLSFTPGPRQHPQATFARTEALSVCPALRAPRFSANLVNLRKFLNVFPDCAIANLFYDLELR
jgi:hypothetical protein